MYPTQVPLERDSVTCPVIVGRLCGVFLSLSLLFLFFSIGHCPASLSLLLIRVDQAVHHP